MNVYFFVESIKEKKASRKYISPWLKKANLVRSSLKFSDFWFNLNFMATFHIDLISRFFKPLDGAFDQA